MSPLKSRSLSGRRSLSRGLSLISRGSMNLSLGPRMSRGSSGLRGGGPGGGGGAGPLPLGPFPLPEPLLPLPGGGGLRNGGSKRDMKSLVRLKGAHQARLFGRTEWGRLSFRGGRRVDQHALLEPATANNTNNRQFSQFDSERRRFTFYTTKMTDSERRACTNNGCGKLFADSEVGRKTRILQLWCQPPHPSIAGHSSCLPFQMLLIMIHSFLSCASLSCFSRFGS